jgi:hypothetical protein
MSPETAVLPEEFFRRLLPSADPNIPAKLDPRNDASIFSGDPGMRESASMSVEADVIGTIAPAVTVAADDTKEDDDGGCALSAGRTCRLASASINDTAPLLTAGIVAAAPVPFP